MAIEYKTFEIRIRKLIDKIIVEAIGPDGESGESQTHAPDDEILGVFNQISYGRASEEHLLKIGDALGEILMPNPILQLYTAALQRTRKQSKQGLRLRIKFLGEAKEYQQFPWEAVRINDKPIVLDPYQAIVRSVDSPEPATPLEVETPPYRILIVSEAPSGLPKLEFEREISQIREQLTPLMNQGLIHIEVTQNPTLEELEKILRQGDFHVLHYTGHASINSDTGNGFLAFVNRDGGVDTVDGDRLGNVLIGTGVRLAFLNSNETAFGHSTGQGIAEALLVVGIPIAIAFNSPISDKIASLFAIAFYTELVKVNSLEQAMFTARRAIGETESKSTPFWANPVLLARTPASKFWTGQAGYKVETFIQDGKLIAEAVEKIGFDAKAFANRLQTALDNIQLIEARNDRLKAQQIIAEAQDAITNSQPETASQKLTEALTSIYLTVSEQERERKVKEENNNERLRKQKEESKSRWAVLSITLVLLLVVALLGYLLRDSWTPSMTIPVISIPVSVIVWSFIGGVAAMLQAFVGSRKEYLSKPTTYEWLLWRPIVGVLMGSVVYLAIAAGLVVFGQGNFSSLANTNNPYFMWMLAFLGGFSDKFAIAIFDNVVRTFSNSPKEDAQDEIVKDNNSG